MFQKNGKFENYWNLIGIKSVLFCIQNILEVLQKLSLEFVCSNQTHDSRGKHRHP